VLLPVLASHCMVDVPSLKNKRVELFFIFLDDWGRKRNAKVLLITQSRNKKK
jgi:hypothetical protein